MIRKLATALCISAGALGASAAHATVIPLGTVDMQGTGVGAMYTLLDLTSPANSTTETGSVSWNGTTSVVAGSQVNGGSNNTTYTFGAVGINQASDLRVVLDINEPGNDGQILLSSLIFNVYGAAGNVVWTGQLASPLSLTQTQSGTGSAGHLFGLDSAQALALQSVWNPGLHFGISATLGNAGGGPETFFLANAASVTPQPQPGPQVPEPGTLALLGLSMLGGVAVIRRKKAG